MAIRHRGGPLVFPEIVVDPSFSPCFPTSQLPRLHEPLVICAPKCPRAVGAGTPFVHCLSPYGPWALEFIIFSASLPGDIGQWSFSGTVPHRLGAVCSGTPSMHSLLVRS